MNRRSRLLAAPLIGAAIALTAAGFAAADAAPPSTAAAPAHPWMNPKLSPDKRAQLAVAAMTNDEKLVLVRRRLLDLHDLEHIGRSIFTKPDRFHALAMVGQNPIWSP